MNEFKGTPGPWFHHGPSGSQHTMGGYINSSPERNSSSLVCSIYGTNGQPHEENAKLIAASPKLFKAVNDFLNHFEGKIPLWLLEEAESAIADALGK